MATRGRLLVIAIAALVAASVVAFLLMRPGSACDGTPARPADPAPRASEAGPRASQPTAVVARVGSPPDGAATVDGGFARASGGGATVDGGMGAPPPGLPASIEATVLSPDAPDEVEVVATRDVGSARFVLFRTFPGRTWRRKRKADGTWERFEAARMAIEERCDEQYAYPPAIEQCVLERTACAYFPGNDREWHAWEVARLDRRDAGWSLAARRVLWGHAPVDRFEESELRANDLDRDGRPEVTAIYSVRLVDADGMIAEDWRVGTILDGADLHVEFEIARMHSTTASDAETHTRTSEVTWRAVDEDRDGVIDLKLRESTRATDEPLEGEPSESAAARTTLCRYDSAADRWTCPPFGDALPEDHARILDCATTPPEVPPEPDAGP